MPEIAEVETVKRVLKERIQGRTIKRINVLYDKIVETDLEEFKKELVGLSFNDVLRKGKWLLFDIGDYYLCSHLRMEGKYFIKKNDDPIEKHEHIIFSLDDGNDLRYHDTRKFGRMDLILKDKIIDFEGIRKQGIEANDVKLSKEYLYEKIKKSNLPIKTLLLDQTIISGLGNIYANEVLFAAKINPFKLGKEISLKECQNIVDASKRIIEKAIHYGGTTIRSYTSSLGVTGRYQEYLMVHCRDGEKCLNCDGLIVKKVIGGRSTYLCPKCQK